MKALRVVVLKTGSLLREGLILKDARSSVTLIDAGERKIIVDTGFLGEEGIILDALAARNLVPENIDFVVNTHLHLDHCGCNILFRKSVFYADRMECPPIMFRDAKDGAELVPGVSFLSTPGHTYGSTSVVVEADGEKYVIAGDAIPTLDNYRGMSPPLINIDEKLAMESMKRILKVADFVIPGHDAMFKVDKRVISRTA